MHNVLTYAMHAGYLRKGCVHITVDVLVSCDVYEESEEAGVIGLAQHLQGLPDTVWHEGHILLSVHDQVAFLKVGPPACTHPCGPARTLTAPSQRP